MVLKIKFLVSVLNIGFYRVLLVFHFDNSHISFGVLSNFSLHFTIYRLYILVSVSVVDAIFSLHSCGFVILFSFFFLNFDMLSFVNAFSISNLFKFG